MIVSGTASYWMMLAFGMLVSFGIGAVGGATARTVLDMLDATPALIAWPMRLILCSASLLIPVVFVMSYGLDGLFLLTSGLLRQLTGQSTELNFLAVGALVVGIALVWGKS